jgi:hypothetical protein
MAGRKGGMWRKVAKDAAQSYAQEQVCDWMGVKSPRTGASLGGAIGEIGYMGKSAMMRQHKATTQGFSGHVVKDLQNGKVGGLDAFKLKNIE